MKEIFQNYQVYVNGNQWRGTYEDYARAIAKAETLKKDKNLYVEIWKYFTIGGKTKRRLIAYWN